MGHSKGEKDYPEYYAAVCNLQNDVRALKSGYQLACESNDSIPPLDKTIYLESDQQSLKYRVNHQGQVLQGIIRRTDLSKEAQKDLSALFQPTTPQSLTTTQLSQIQLFLYDVLKAIEQQQLVQLLPVISSHMTFSPKKVYDQISHVYSGEHRLASSAALQNNATYYQQLLDIELKVCENLLHALNHEPLSDPGFFVKKAVGDQPFGLYMATDPDRQKILLSCAQARHSSGLPQIVDEKTYEFSSIYLKYLRHLQKDTRMMGLVASLNKLPQSLVPMNLDPVPKIEKLQADRANFLRRKTIMTQHRTALDYQRAVIHWQQRMQVVDQLLHQPLATNLKELNREKIEAAKIAVQQERQQLEFAFTSLANFPSRIVQSRYLDCLGSSKSHKEANAAWEDLLSQRIQPQFVDISADQAQRYAIYQEKKQQLTELYSLLETELAALTLLALEIDSSDSDEEIEVAPLPLSETSFEAIPQPLNPLSANSSAQDARHIGSTFTQSSADEHSKSLEELKTSSSSKRYSLNFFGRSSFKIASSTKTQSPKLSLLANIQKILRSSPRQANHPTSAAAATIEVSSVHPPVIIPASTAMPEIQPQALPDIVQKALAKRKKIQTKLATQLMLLETKWELTNLPIVLSQQQWSDLRPAQKSWLLKCQNMPLTEFIAINQLIETDTKHWLEIETKKGEAVTKHPDYQAQRQQRDKLIAALPYQDMAIKLSELQQKTEELLTQYYQQLWVTLIQTPVSQQAERLLTIQQQLQADADFFIDNRYPQVQAIRQQLFDFSTIVDCEKKYQQWFNQLDKVIENKAEIDAQSQKDAEFFKGFSSTEPLILDKFNAVAEQRKTVLLTCNYSNERQNLYTNFFKKPDGIFIKYLQERQQQYYYRDILDTFACYCSYIIGGYYWYETAHMQKTNVVNALAKATLAYQKDPSKFDNLRQSLQRVLGQKTKPQQNSPSLFAQVPVTPEPRTFKAKMALFEQNLMTIEAKFQSPAVKKNTSKTHP